MEKRGLLNAKKLGYLVDLRWSLRSGISSESPLAWQAVGRPFISDLRRAWRPGTGHPDKLRFPSPPAPGFRLGSGAVAGRVSLADITIIKSVRSYCGCWASVSRLGFFVDKLTAPTLKWSAISEGSGVFGVVSRPSPRPIPPLAFTGRSISNTPHLPAQKVGGSPCRRSLGGGCGLGMSKFKASGGVIR